MDNNIFEESEFYKKVDELGNKLIESLANVWNAENQMVNVIVNELKKQSQEEIERLKKENKELREFKEKYEKLEDELIKRENKLRREISLMKLDELFENCGNRLVRWTVSRCEVYKKKCEKCNYAGLILFKSPTGKGYSEVCECRKGFNKYYPKKIVCVGFNEVRTIGSNKVSMTYREHDNRYILYEDPDCCDDLEFEKIKDEMSYTRNICFSSKEKCEEFCSYLNTKNGITEDMDINN